MRRIFEYVTSTAADWLPPTGYPFHLKGSITIQEFLDAGDHILSLNKGWKWKGASSDTQVEYLPAERQYLFHPHLKCLKIPKTELTQVDNGWNVYTTTTHEDYNENKFSGSSGKNFRIYDEYKSYSIGVTYDRFYETPRIWLQGFNTMGLPLDRHQMMEDVPKCYLGKTITVERHPFTNVFNLTVHPCYQIDAIVTENKDKTDFCPKMAIVYAINIWASIFPNLALLDTIESHTVKTYSKENKNN